MRISPKEIVYLAGKYPQATNVSLMKTLGRTISPDGNEEQQLRQSGLLTASGGVLGEADALLSVIADARRYGRAVYRGVHGIVEKNAYCLGERTVVAANEEGVFEIESVGQGGENLVFPINLLLPPMEREFMELAVELPADEFLALMAVVDLFRRSTILQYCGTGGETTAWSAEDVASMTTGEFQNGLFNLISHAFGLSFNRQNVDSSLRGLCDKGLVLEGEGYVLSKPMVDFSGNLLIINHAVTLENIELVGNDVAVANSVTYSSGLQLIAAFEYDGENVSFTVISSETLHAMIHACLLCPAIAPERSSAPPPVVPPPLFVPAAEKPSGARRCICGRTVTGAFCPGCGRPAATDTVAASDGVRCPHCGSQRPAGAKFCAKCGGAIQ